MNPPFHDGLHERVAVLETQVSEVRASIKDMCLKEEGIKSMLNTIFVQLATLSQKVDGIVSERTVWKNPMVYISLSAVIVSAVTLYLK